MTHSMVKLGIAIVATMAAACSGSDSTGWSQSDLAVQGTVSEALTLDNARAVAIGSDGRTFWTYLDRERDFTLLLPVGQSYRVVIANALPGGGQIEIAHLLPQGSGETAWLGANVAGTVDLGTLRPPPGQGGTTACLSCGSPSGDDRRGRDHHGDDNGCHEGPSRGDGGDGMCVGANDEPLEPTNRPGPDCADRGHHGADGGKDGDGDGNPCPSGGGTGSPCTSASGCAAGLMCTAGVCASPPSGGGGVGAECLTNNDCATGLGLMCVSGMCSP
jgi:hypothetical protein